MVVGVVVLAGGGVGGRGGVTVVFNDYATRDTTRYASNDARYTADAQSLCQGYAVWAVESPEWSTCLPLYAVPFADTAKVWEDDGPP